MKLKQFFFGLIIVLQLFSCKEIDETFKEYIVKGGLVYAGKPVNPIIRPGYYRVELSWLRGADPNVTKAKIFWDNYTDSLEVDIPIDNDSITIMLNKLEEKYYSFYIFTYDDSGNSSILTELQGPVYGEKLRTSLLNRPILYSEMSSTGKIHVSWGAADELNGAYAVDIYHTDINTGDLVKQRFDVKTSISEWDGDIENKYFYQTVYLPDTLSIDTLSTDLMPLLIQKTDVTNLYLKNAERPFTYNEWDGFRYGCLTDWITNEAVKNKNGDRHGGFDNLNNGGSFGVEQWTNERSIINGKIYQTFTLSPGNYSLTVFFGSENPGVANSGNDPRYLVASIGDTLPDVDNITSALAYVSLIGVPTTDKRTINFSITETSEISVGVLVNFISTRQNIRLNSFQLCRNN